VQNGEATQNIIKHIATLFIAGYLHKFTKISKNTAHLINRDLATLKTKKNRLIQQSFYYAKNIE
jgi:hypothetical protein